MITTPFEFILQRLRFRAKFGLVFVLILLGLSILGASIVRERSKQIALIERESAGIPVWRPMLESLRLMQQSRGLSAKWVGGDDSAKAKMQTKMGETNAALAKVEAGLQSLPLGAAKFAELKSAWRAVEDMAKNANPELPAAHTRTIAQGLSVLSGISEETGLDLGGEPDTYYLQTLLYNLIPEAIEYYGRFRALGTVIIQQGQVKPAQQIQLHVLRENIERGLNRIVGRAEAMAGRSNILSNYLHDYAQAVAKRRDILIAVIDNELLVGKFDRDPQVFFDEMTSLINAAYEQTESKLYPVFERRMQERLDGARAERNSALAIIAAVSLICGLLFWAMGRNIVSQVQILRDGADALARGELDVPLPAMGNDELTGAVSAFNEGRLKLGALLRQVRMTIVDIGREADLISTSSEQIAAAAANQADTVSEVAATMEQMSVGVESISSSANTAQGYAVRSESLSVEGGQRVARTIDGISAIACRVEESALIIQRLGTESAKISQIVGTIKEIADQTNLLALNAAIEAARAGESGRGFAVVADEVRKLAERTGGATQEIAQNISKIQVDIASAVGAMNLSVSNVSQGVEIAKISGEAVREIHNQSVEVQGRVSDISTALREQTIAVAAVAGNLESLAQMSERNHAAAESAKQAARSLWANMGKLEAKVAEFRI